MGSKNRRRNVGRKTESDSGRGFFGRTTTAEEDEENPLLAGSAAASVSTQGAAVGETWSKKLFAKENEEFEKGHKKPGSEAKPHTQRAWADEDEDDEEGWQGGGDVQGGDADRGKYDHESSNIKEHWEVSGNNDMQGSGLVQVYTTWGGREKLRYIRPYQGRKPGYVAEQQRRRQQYYEEEARRRAEDEEDDDPDGPWIYYPNIYQIGFNTNLLVNEIHRNTISSLNLDDLERSGVFTDYEMLPVAMALKHNSSLQSLTLRALPCTDTSLVPLFEGLVDHPSLVKVHFSALDAKSATAKALVKLVTTNPNIVDVTVSECHFLTDAQEEALHTATQYHLLEAPDLQRSHLGASTIGNAAVINGGGISAVVDPVPLEVYPKEAKRQLRAGKRPICGEFVNSLKCRFGSRCLLLHPLPCTSTERAAPRKEGEEPAMPGGRNPRPELFLDPATNKLTVARGYDDADADGDGEEESARKIRPFTMPKLRKDEATGAVVIEEAPGTDDDDDSSSVANADDSETDDEPESTAGQAPQQAAPPSTLSNKASTATGPPSSSPPTTQPVQHSPSALSKYLPVVVGSICVLGIVLALRKENSENHVNVFVRL